MIHHYTPKALAMLGAALLLTVTTAQAASINWGAAQNITGHASDVSTNGDLVYALNFGGTQGTTRISPTINGVTFTGANSSGMENVFSTTAVNWSRDFTGRDSGTFITLPEQSQTLLKSYMGISKIADAPSTFTITLEGLTVNSHYEIQLWVNHSGFQSPGMYYGMDVSAGNSVVLKTNVHEKTGDTGQYVTGTFTADATTQTITFTTTMNDSLALINALQLREIQQIPEAGTYALIFTGCAAVVAIAYRKRRR